MKLTLLLDAVAVACWLVGGAGDASPVLVEDFTERQSAGTAALVADDIQRRVASAGGNVAGIIVASLAWSTADDLDLHVKTPSGAEISYSNKQASGGELDVDMCVHGRHSGKCTESPVENIVFTDEAAQGRYEVYVQNFNYHPDVRSRELQVSHVLEGKRPSKENQELRFGTNRPVPFEVLVKVEGTQRLFSGICTPSGKTHTASNVQVFAFEYFPNAITDEGRVMPVFEQRSDPACEVIKQKLLSSGAEKRSFIEGSSGAHTGQIRGRDEDSARSPKRAKAPAPSGQKPSKRSRTLERAKEVALQAVISSSRDSLMAKPPKILRELLTDLGTFCRGCLDKSELVDRLLEVAEVPSAKQEL